MTSMTAFDARRFGVLPNSSADQTAFLQLAIDAAADARTQSGFVAGGTVFLPDGWYWHAGLTLKNRVLIKGAGKHRTVLALLPGSNRHAVTNIDPKNPDYATGFQRAGLQDLTLHGGWSRTKNPSLGTSSGSQGSDDGSWATSYDGFHLETHGTISANAAIVPELTGDPRCILRSVTIFGVAGTGVFLGGPGAYDNGANYRKFGSGSMIVEDVQIWDCRRFGLHNLMNDNHFLGIEVGPCDWAGIVADGAQCAWVNCKSWYSGRDSSGWELARARYSAGQAGWNLLQPRHFGACYVIKDNNTLSVLKAQDSAGHGAVIDGPRVSFTNANLDQIGEIAGPPGAAQWETINATATDRYGVYIHGAASAHGWHDIVARLTSKNSRRKARSVVHNRTQSNRIIVWADPGHLNSDPTVGVHQIPGVETRYTFNGGLFGSS